jgi:hypothetical protein
LNLNKRLEKLEKLLNINSYQVHYDGDPIKITADTVVIRLRWADLPENLLENVQEIDFDLPKNIK